MSDILLVEIGPRNYRPVCDGETATHTHDAKGAVVPYCPPPPAGAIVINQGASGIGDAISASLAVNGFRLREQAAGTGKPIVYKVSAPALPFVRLLDLGTVTLAQHDWDGGDLEIKRPPGAPPGDIQLHTFYSEECQTRGQFTRLQRNCRNLGGVTPALPELRDRAGLLAGGRDYEGCIVLSPFSMFASREWPAECWRRLEARLREHGYHVIVMDGIAPGDRRQRAAALTSEKLIDAPAEQVVGVMLNAACVVSNDSGLAHVAAVVGAPTLVLCSEFPGETIFAPYGPAAQWINKPLAAVTVDEVLRQVLTIAGPPHWPAHRNGETSKAHARRLREGWYAEHCRAPLLDVGCWVDYLLPGFPCARWDQMYGDGDATHLATVADESYATVYASHVLEHVSDPHAALRSWWRVLKPGGKLLVMVPHRDLYEGKLDLPSRWNGDHKTFWLPEAPAPDDLPHTRGLRQVLTEAIPGGEIISLRVLDDGHSYPDKTVHPQGEFSIEVVVRKP